ncbi:prolipoprotein diacylglyceryl transferase, partial [Octadecabacter sp.]|nr:prolipoprotein diacylglyceryl transferase [Octadecabacter sp.]
MLAAISFPDISPEIFTLTLFGFTFALRWYALGYIVGIVIGWWIAMQASKR